MTFIIISIGARAQITDWADNVLIDTDNAVSPITDVWWLHGWDAAEPSSADWVARRELEQTQNIFITELLALSLRLSEVPDPLQPRPD